MRRYTILLDRDPSDGSYAVTVPALPGLVARGRDREDAVAAVKDAIRSYIDGLLRYGQPIPEEGEPPQLATVEVEEGAQG